MPTSVALSSHFETFVKEQVNGGRFNNVSEVVRAGLRLLEDQEQVQALKLQELRMAINAGASSGRGVESEAGLIPRPLGRTKNDSVRRAL